MSLTIGFVNVQNSKMLKNGPIRSHAEEKMIKIINFQHSNFARFLSISKGFLSRKKMGVTDHLREQTASEFNATATHSICVWRVFSAHALMHDLA